MSLFSRIYQIVRANLNFSKDSDLPPGETFYEEFKRKQAARNRNSADGGYQQSENNDSYDSGYQGYDEAGDPYTDPGDKDPELAQYYANLEVPYGSDLETVRKAWKQLLRKYHPDLHSQDPDKQKLSNELVQEINSAYRELEKRLKS